MSITLPEGSKLIFKCVAGSFLYGTNTPESHIDERGVFIPSEEYILGFAKRIEQIEKQKEGEDSVYTELRKFLDLASKNNPNIIEYLFVPKNMWLHATKEWEKIIENMANSYGYFKYFLIYLIVLIITQILNWAKYEKMPQFDLFNLVFLSAYFGLYFLLYSWYVPIAEGNRLVLAQFMPAMFAISLGLQETLKTSVVKLFERPVPALFVINGVVLLVLLVDIYLILTVRIINTWSGS